jgi:tetratricopeptide (TPR) repeat protein
LIARLAQYLMVSGRPEDALARIARALEASGTPDAVRASLLQTRAAVRVQIETDSMDALSQSIADLDEASRLGPEQPLEDLATLLDRQRTLAGQKGQPELERATTLRLARVLPQIGQAPAGVNLLVGWIRDYPTDADAVTALGELALEAGKGPAAVKAFQRLVEITTGEARCDAVLRLAEACEQTGTPLEAQSLLQQVYKETNGDARVGQRLKTLLEAAGAHEELARFLLGELEQVSDPETLFVRLSDIGKLLMRTKSGAREAASALARAHELKPDDHETLTHLAEAYLTADRISEAQALLEKAIERHGKKRTPPLSELHHVMAHAARAAGDDQAFLNWLDSAMTIDRQNGKAASELAREAMERGLQDLAIKALQLVTLLKDPGPMSRAEAYLRQAIIAKEKGDPKKAVLLAKRALAAENQYEEAKAFLAQLGE